MYGRMAGEIMKQASQDRGGSSKVQGIHLKNPFDNTVLTDWGKAWENVEIIQQCRESQMKGVAVGIKSKI